MGLTHGVRFFARDEAPINGVAQAQKGYKRNVNIPSRKSKKFVSRSGTRWIPDSAAHEFDFANTSVREMLESSLSR